MSDVIERLRSVSGRSRPGARYVTTSGRDNPVPGRLGYPDASDAAATDSPSNSTTAARDVIDTVDGTGTEE